MNDSITRLALDEALTVGEYLRQRLLQATIISDSSCVELPSNDRLLDMEQVACDVDASEDELRELAFDLIKFVKTAAYNTRYLNNTLKSKGD